MHDFLIARPTSGRLLPEEFHKQVWGLDLVSMPFTTRKYGV